MAPEIVKKFAPGPIIDILLVISGKFEVKVKVPVNPEVKSICVIDGSEFEELIAHLKVPTLPLSLVLVTVILLKLEAQITNEFSNTNNKSDDFKKIFFINSIYIINNKNSIE
ncbi:MAG: hypothetical protein EBR38_07800 [Flavobacteriaceae bacterium]|nr:hypothetical protein [Flavobacteriaceae bacterium]